MKKKRNEKKRSSQKTKNETRFVSNELEEKIRRPRVEYNKRLEEAFFSEGTFFLVRACVADRKAVQRTALVARRDVRLLRLFLTSRCFEG